jgi:hypothetical protein
LAILLYRVVVPAEWADIQAVGFRPAWPSFQGKWFAESLADARRWAGLLNRGAACHIIEVDVPDDFANRLYRDPFLDRVGPGRHAYDDQLPELNQRMRPPTDVT